MSPRKVTLIDGQFLRSLCDFYAEKVGTDFFSQLNWQSVSLGAARTFYYDSLPAQRLNQTDEEFEIEYQAKIDELNFIRSQRWYHVKDGVSRFRRRDKRREQKGVDMLLAIDAVQIAAQGLADEITIITSDTDFYPVFEAMNQTRCRGVLRYQRDHASDDLIFAADDATPIELRDVASWANCGPGHAESIFPSQEATRTLPDEAPDFGNRPSAHAPFLTKNAATGEFEFYSHRGNTWYIQRSNNAYVAFELANSASPERYPFRRLSEVLEW